MPMNPRLMRPTAAKATTLYYAGGDLSWGTLGNWWFDAAYTRPANRLPGVRDTVVVSGLIDTPPEGPVTIANLIVSQGSLFGLEITVTGTATFSGVGSSMGATINGNAVFTDTFVTGTVNGNATFKGTAYSDGGVINGNATFNDSATNNGTVTGTATFTGNACNVAGTAGAFVPDPPPSCPE